MTEKQELMTLDLAVDSGIEEKFYKLFRPRLYSTSMGILGGNGPEAEAAVRDTLLAALPLFKGGHDSSSAYAWLRQICLRCCYARLRALGLAARAAAKLPERISPDAAWLITDFAAGLR